MALVKCEECGHLISDKAEECPKCGCPNTAYAPEPEPTYFEPEDPDNEPDPNRRKGMICLIIAIALLAVAAGVLGYFIYSGHKTNEGTDTLAVQNIEDTTGADTSQKEREMASAPQIETSLPAAEAVEAEEAVETARVESGQWQEVKEPETSGPAWLQGSWELIISSPYGVVATYHLTVRGRNAHLVESGDDKYNGRYEIRDGYMIVGPRKYRINEDYQRLEYVQYRWRKTGGGSGGQSYSGRGSSFSTPSDVMRYLSGRRFYNSGYELRIDYGAVYMNGRAMTGAPRVVDFSGNSATIVANSPYSGGGTLHFYVNSSSGTVTQNGDVYRER